MATYADAAQARELINRVAHLNNVLVRNLEEMVAIRSKLTALTPAQQDVVRQAVRDMGYDDAEIVAILNRANTIAAEATRVGLAAVTAP